MGRELAALLGSGVLLATSGAVMAHHSFAMFDQENPIELTVPCRSSNTPVRTSTSCWRSRAKTAARDLEFLRARLRACWPGMDGRGQTLKPGDEIIITIHPLQSGAPGGAWNVIRAKFKDGRPIGGSP